MKNNNSFARLPLLSALLLTLTLLPLQAYDEQPSMVNTIPPIHNSTVMVNLKPENSSAKESQKWSNALRAALPGIPNIVMIDKEAVKEKELSNQLPKTCDSVACAGTYARALNSHMIIAGSLQKVEEEKEKLMGDEGKYKYLLHRKEDVTYIIKIFLYDAKRKTVLTELRSKSKESESKKTINYLVNRLKPYYLPPVIIQKEKPVKKKITRVLAFQADYLLPRGKYSDFAGSGYGLSVYGGLYDFFFRKSTVSLFLSGIYLQPESDVIKNYIMNRIGLQLLYEFNLTEKYSILPGVSGGYLLHNVNTKTAGFRMYRDPFVQCELNLRRYIKDDIFIQAGPSYIVFFEKTNKGHSLECHLSAVMFYR